MFGLAEAFVARRGRRLLRLRNRLIQAHKTSVIDVKGQAVDLCAQMQGECLDVALSRAKMALCSRIGELVVAVLRDR